jgi:ribose transport system substrate-binding protein
LTKRPPRNVSVAFVPCPVPECTSVAQAAQAAANTLGWKLTFFQGGLTPATQVSATQNAVESRPSAVLDIQVFPPKIIAKPLATAQQLHVPVVSIASIFPASGPIIASIGNERHAVENASTDMADWVIADSDGKANVLAYSGTGVATQEVPPPVIRQVFAKDCPGCKLAVQPLNVANTGTSFPGQLVSYLQTHQGIQYVILPDGSEATGVATAIKAAGLPMPKIVTRVSTPVNFTEVTKGLEAGAIGEEGPSLAWRAMDIVARRSVGDSITVAGSQTSEIQLLVKSNITNPSQPWNVPDLPQTFAKIWRISG